MKFFLIETAKTAAWAGVIIFAGRCIVGLTEAALEG